MMSLVMFVVGRLAQLFALAWFIWHGPKDIPAVSAAVMLCILCIGAAIEGNQHRKGFW